MAASQPVCPFHKNDQTIVLFSKQWIISNRMFKFSASASLTIQKGAEGFSIAPNLPFRPIVPRDSPVFCLLWETEKGLKSRMAGTKIERAQQKLLKLFMNGEGAHSDTLPDGNTILHVSFFPWAKSEWTVFYLVGLYVSSTFFLTNELGSNSLAGIQPSLG
jgi:hypothetical protein